MKVQYDEQLSKFAFKFNLRHYSAARCGRTAWSSALCGTWRTSAARPSLSAGRWALARIARLVISFQLLLLILPLLLPLLILFLLVLLLLPLLPALGHAARNICQALLDGVAERSGGGTKAAGGGSAQGGDGATAQRGAQAPAAGAHPRALFSST